MQTCTRKNKRKEEELLFLLSGNGFSMVATLSGYLNLTSAHEGTCKIYADGVLVGSATSTVALSIYVTAGQRIDIVWSDPSSVTYLDFHDSRLNGNISQIEQFVNLAEFYDWNNEPTGHIVDTELLTNSYEPTDLTGWTQSPGTQWAATGGSFVFTANSTAQYLGRNFSGVVGNVYQFEYYVSQNSLDAAGLQTSSNGIFANVSMPVTVGLHRLTLFAINAAPTHDLWFTTSPTSTSGTITIDYFSVKSITNSVTNGGFDADSDWTKSDAAVTIAAGVADWSGAQAAAATLSQASASTVGLQCLVEYTLTRSAGTMTPSLNGTALPTRAAAGTYLEYVTAGSDPNVIFSGDADFAGTLDNVLLLPWPDQSIGSISSIAGLTTIEIDSMSALGWAVNAFDESTGLTTLTLDALNWSVEDVNAMFASLVVANAVSTLATVITLLNMPVPTGQGDTDVTTLAADGCTVTINGAAY